MMSWRSLPLITLAIFACRGESDPSTSPTTPTTLEPSASRMGGSEVVSFPEEDPGPPYYARVTTIHNQIFHDNGYVAIPFYRDPACVPPDFDLLQALHLPGPSGPGAFGCPLVVEGHYLIEPDAPQGMFPIRVVTKGPAPIWFVPWSAFLDATADGDLTMEELMAADPLHGVADTFHEMLAPRAENHHVVITSRGTLEDGRVFQFNVNHRGDQTRSILIRIGAGRGAGR